MSPTPDVLRFACAVGEIKPSIIFPDDSRHSLSLQPCGPEDEEHRSTISGYQVILRRVHCVIHDGLLRRDDPRWQLSPQTRAALLWRAYQRYDQLVGLKRLSGGLSGSDVLVFRPRLRAPKVPRIAAMASAGPPDVLSAAWGSPLLVKTGKAEDILQEWERAETFLRDRPSPFIARNEERLDVRPTGESAAVSQATLISSFLGGELVQAEPLDKLIRGTQSADRALRAIDAVVDLLSSWHTNPSPRNLAQWPRAFYFAGGLPREDWPANQPETAWLAFRRFNLRKRNVEEAETWDTRQPSGPSLGRAEFAAGVGWDIPFGSRLHLERHLLGQHNRCDGLLYKLAGMPALFSLVHGDLNPRNVLCDADKIWLIDFQHVGVGPVLADFARLEVNLRLWCIELGPGTAGAAEAARALELLLLDHLHGSESSLEPLRSLAAPLGATPEELEKIARCVIHIRRLARRWRLPEFTDGRDYIAALYLSVLSLLPEAGGHTGPGNARWVLELAWTLEETLDRLFDREPFDRERLPYDPVFHISPKFILPPDAPQRIDSLCSTTDGQQALQPVVALRGVLQGSYHHLDAYQHTLSVLAYMEAILENPVEGLLHPGRLDTTVAASLREYGPSVPPSSTQANAKDVDAAWFQRSRSSVEKWLESILNEDAKLLLKWCALLHDVGKPGTRTVSKKPGVPRMQFHGHEKFGPALLRSRLQTWFPDPDVEERIDAIGLRLRQLIHNHHRSHQLIGDYFLRDTKDRELFQLLAGEPNTQLRKWIDDRLEDDLPLLLLHGYADRLAARGLRQLGTVTEWSAVTLALLTYLALR